MKIDCAYDELVPVNKLVPHPRNNNRHSIEQIQTLAKLIDAHGFRYPIVVSRRSGFVVSGHGRIDALKALKVNEAPVDYQDFSSEAEEYQVLTSDNEIARWSELDLHAVHLALEEIPGIDLEFLAIPIEKLKKPFLEDIELPQESSSKEPKMIHCPNCGEVFEK